MGNGKKGQGSRSRGPANRGGEHTNQLVLIPWNTRTLENKVAYVKPLWDTLSHEERVGLLTVPISDLRKRATELAWTQRQKSGINVAKALEEGLARLEEGPSWKRWQICGSFAHDTSNVRRWVEQECEAHRLPEGFVDEWKPREYPADAEHRSFVGRMQHLRAAVDRSAGSEEARCGPSAVLGHWSTTDREKDIDDICYILQEVVLEQDTVCTMLQLPVISYICGALKADQRNTTETLLNLQDLERLHPTQVARIRTWLVQKLEAIAWISRFLASELQAPCNIPREVNEFALSEDKLGLTLHPDLLQRLEQGRVLRPDGQVEEVEEGARETMVVEWVLGGFQAAWGEKAREFARHTLGDRNFLVVEAQQLLTNAFKEQQEMKKMALVYQWQMDDILARRRDVARVLDPGSIETPWTGIIALEWRVELVKACDSKQDVAAAKAARATLSAMLQREVCLLDAERQAGGWKAYMWQRTNRKLNYEIQQVHIHRERSRRKKAASTADDPLESVKDTQILAEGRRTDDAQRKTAGIDLCQEVNILQAQRQSLEAWHARLERSNESAPASSEGEPLPAAAQKVPGGSLCAGSTDVEEGMASMGLQETEQSQLESYLKLGGSQLPRSRAQESQLYASHSAQLQAAQRALACLGAMVPHLVAHLEDVACDDPVAAIKDQLLLPLLEERLRRPAADFWQAREARLALEVDHQKARLSTINSDLLLSMEERDRLVNERRQSRKEDAKRAKKLKASEKKYQANEVKMAELVREVKTIKAEKAETEREVAANRERLAMEKLAAQEAKQTAAETGAPKSTLGASHAAAPTAEQRPKEGEHMQGSGVAEHSAPAAEPGSQAGPSGLGRTGDGCGQSGSQEVGKPEGDTEAIPGTDGVPFTGKKNRRRRGKAAWREGAEGCSGAERSERVEQGNSRQALPAEPPSSPGHSNKGAPAAPDGGCSSTAPSGSQEGLGAGPAAQIFDERILEEVEEIVCCPISQELMVDAVTAEDGRTYSQAAIQQWLGTGARTSPLTNMEMGTTLRPNKLIRSLAQTCLAHLEQSDQ